LRSEKKEQIKKFKIRKLGNLKKTGKKIRGISKRIKNQKVGYKKEKGKEKSKS